MKMMHKNLYKRLLALALALSLMLSLTLTVNAGYGDPINDDWEGNANSVSFLGDRLTKTGTLTIPSKYTNEDGETVSVHYVTTSFSGNTKITKVTTSAPLYSYTGFENCTALTSVDFPTTVNSTTCYFRGCTALETVNFKSVSDPDAGENDNPTGMFAIGGEMFRGCTSLKSITIPDDVKGIGSRAFEKCTSLVNVGFSNDMTSIADRAFVNCSSLRSINLPASLESIGEYAFAQCVLESVTIPAGVQHVQLHSFANNPNLNSITILSDASMKDNATVFGKEGYAGDPFEIKGVDNSARTIYGPTGGYTEQFAKHWGYNFNAAAAEKEFTFGTDNYAFANILSSFGAGGELYTLSDANLAMLTKDYPKSFVAELKEQMDKPFYGMCYGMSTTAALFYTGALSQAKVQPGVSTTYALSAPSSNEALRELLALYQLSQYQQTLPDYSISDETPNNLALVNALKAGSDPVVFVGRLKEGATYSHAMLAYKLEEVDSGYKIKVYDPNHPVGPLILNISQDGKTSDFEATYSSVFIKNAITKSDYANTAFEAYVNSGELLKLATNFDSMTIVAGDRTATIENGVQTGGDLVVNCWGPQNDVGQLQTVTFTFAYNYSDGGLTITPVSGSNDGDGYVASLQNNDEDDGSYVSVETDEDSPISIKRGGGVSFTGKKSGNYKVSATSNTTTGTLYTMTAQGTDTGVIVTPTQNGGTVVTANNTPVDVVISGTTDAVTLDDVDVSKSGASIKTDGNSVTITDSISGEILVTGIATDDDNEFLKGFVPALEYKDGQFTDVVKDAWYDAGVELAYQLGIMSGIGNGQFNPDANVSVAQAIKMACVVYSTYTGDHADFSQGDPWFQVYVDYAIKNGIIKADQFQAYAEPATRAEMAAIFANGVSATELQAINAVKSIPDVSEASEEGDPIYLLYRAGVLTGNDARGTFAPSSFISRAQAAAIITRIAVISQRRTLSF